MNYCKPHNRFYSTDTCEPCEKRVITEASKLPLRVEEPQAWPRCHRCWNLSPVCRCDGDITMPDDLPVLTNTLD